MEDMQEERKGNKAKGNPNRTPAQEEVFKRAQEKRIENGRIKKEYAEALKIEKKLELKAKAEQTKAIKENSTYKSEDDKSEDDEPEVIVKKKTKPKPKPNKKIIIQEESTESEDEPEIVYLKKSTKKKPKKKVIIESSSSEEEEQERPQIGRAHV
jgi:hypothetical protein